MAPTVRLVTMAEDRYLGWRAALIEHYAHDKVTAGTWPAADAVRRATESMDELLPGGRNTPDHHLFCGLAPDGDEIGTLWLHRDRGRPDRITAFVYDIEVAPDRRRQGWGRALLSAAEDWCRDAGAGELGLHVFGHNAAAVQLYRSSGYEVTDYSMRKAL